MPHLVISYAKPLEREIEIQSLVQAVWNAAEQSGLFTPSAIKARAIPVEHFVTGNTDQPFIHVDAKLLAGRPDEKKKNLARGIYDAIVTIAGDAVSVSVEPIDMNGESYFKG